MGRLGTSGLPARHEPHGRFEAAAGSVPSSAAEPSTDVQEWIAASVAP